MTDQPGAEVEMAVETLLDKLDRWLMAQPEWLVLMGLPDRQTRRRVADLVAKELLTMPLRSASNEPNRKMRRVIMKQLAKSQHEW